MKTLKIKKFITIFVALAITFSFFLLPYLALSSINAMAEETTIETQIPSTDEVVDSLGGNLTEEDKAEIKDLINKLKEYTQSSDSFFIRNIVPIIVACVVCLFLGIIALIPWLKNKFTIKQLKSTLENAARKVSEYKEERDNYKALIDVEKLKKEIQDFTVSEVKNMEKLIIKTLEAKGIKEDKILAVLLALKDGAINAWEGSASAVACLTQNADAMTLEDKLKENAMMKAYIAEKHGEDGLKELGLI